MKQKYHRLARENYTLSTALQIYCQLHNYPFYQSVNFWILIVLALAAPTMEMPDQGGGDGQWQAHNGMELITAVKGFPRPLNVL